MIGFLAYQQIICQEAFMLFIASGLLWLAGNQQQATKDIQRLGYQLILIALGNIFIGLTEIIFRVFNQRQTK